MGYLAYNSWVARYIMVYYVYLYCLAGAGVAYICSFIKKPVVRFIALAAAVFIPLISVVYPLEFYMSDRGSDFEQDSFNRTIVAEAKKTVPDTAVILSPFLSQYYFLHDFYVVNALNFKTIENLELIMHRYGIDYVMMVRGEGELWSIISADERSFELEEILSAGNTALYKINRRSRKFKVQDAKFKVQI
jgi:hypothetical protein